MCVLYCWWTIRAVNEISPAAIIEFFGNLGGLTLRHNCAVGSNGTPVCAQSGDITGNDFTENIAFNLWTDV